MIGAIGGRVRSLWVRLGRVQPVPLLVRLAVGGCFLAAYALAYPIGLLTGPVAGPLVALAGLAAVHPRRFWPTMAVFVAAGGWLLSTTALGQPVVLWRLLGLATLLYLGHTLCALAGLLPYDAVVAPAVLGRWVGRALAVCLASAVLGVLLLGLPRPPVEPGHLAAVIGGLAVAVVLAAVLRLVARRH